MNLEHYKFSANVTFLDYVFESDGPKGKIVKGIRLRKISDNPVVYNLAFGDLDPATGRLSDLSVTDNKDRDKILATIAAAVIVFSEHYPGSMVFAKGSTLARTRLYQMRIAANLDTIQARFRVYGYYNGQWELFVKNRTYEALMVQSI